MWKKISRYLLGKMTNSIKGWHTQLEIKGIYRWKAQTSLFFPMLINLLRALHRLGFNAITSQGKKISTAKIYSEIIWSHKAVSKSYCSNSCLCFLFSLQAFLEDKTKLQNLHWAFFSAATNDKTHWCRFRDELLCST